ncbi:Hypothetical predicted protein [Lecanosticta acicola]|uniref:Phosphoglycerate mutase family protein n=1 Tax=Lecanosticta acicola TaxID=111012 RepID=A0AAI8YPB9_9PEZI|nr:Hypothetical predicted protein [Lecanosticta acicola]
MATQSPAVVIIARHGMRLDAADQSWHLSTPTPYDPPLTYGGWNQCRALGVRIASLLHAREQSFNNAAENAENGVQKRKKRKQKVVIHTSPFLRCLQTSVAISAGMAQYEPPKERPAPIRSPHTLHSSSPRLRARDGAGSPHLAPIAEPRYDFVRGLARRRALGEQKRYRKAKIRVDAFLGEWLNPQYFDQITPPPPSPMMLATAKAELMQQENLDLFTPTLSHKSSGNSLWGGSNGRAMASREGSLDDWSHVTDALHSTSPRRERSNSVSSVGSNDSSGGRKSPFRHGSNLQMTSIVPKETSIYHPPTPSYAISSSDHIPRGYVTHARNATANVDYQWDSSRAPQDWGNGGEYGEEWSAMHRRFRKGLNSLIQWYSQHNADDRGEDALGFEQADKHQDHDAEDVEELVVILVTHGAGSNALIGALTNQPVLLDVGMASLTMAVRKDDAPSLQALADFNAASPDGTPAQFSGPARPSEGHRRRSSVDIGLNSVYEMKLVSSSEHLRPGAQPAKTPTSSVPTNLRNTQDALPKYKRFGAGSHGEAGAGIESNWNLGEPTMKRSNTSTAIGSILRPSSSPVTRQPSPGIPRSNTLGTEDRSFSPPNLTTGLWTPPSGRGTPKMTAQKPKDERDVVFSKLNDSSARRPPSHEAMPDFNSPPDSRPHSSLGKREDSAPNSPAIQAEEKEDGRKDRQQGSRSAESAEDDNLGDLPAVSEKLPVSLSRGLSQKGLWGARPSGDVIARKFANSPKRRWTTSRND